MKIVALSGFSKSGKDTAYAFLDHSKRYVRVAFADPLKQDVSGCVVALLNHVPGFDLSIPEQKDKFRPMWVLWSKVSKLFDPMIWVKRAAETIYAQREDAIIVVTDVRYDFEVDFIQSLGGRVFYIDRPGVGPANEEEFISFFDIFTAFPEITSDPIYNDGTKEQLGAALQERIECMKI